MNEVEKLKEKNIKLITENANLTWRNKQSTQMMVIELIAIITLLIFTVI